MPHKNVTNWGNFPSIEANVQESSDISAIQDLVKHQDSMIARGNGRCYGDSSLNANIFSTLKLNKFLSFDIQGMVIECEAGVLLSDVLEVIVPKRLFLPVTPGTKFVTVGGCIAADVHGKNHHNEGSFADHVIDIRLLTSKGELVQCSRTENPDLFWQTCGGMGLTGIILSAKFKLKAIETTYVSHVSHKAADIEGVMRLFEEFASFTYSVAWIDCFARKKHLGRSMLGLGEHSTVADLPSKLRGDPLRHCPVEGVNIPFFFPKFTINYATVKAFNFVYYHKQITQRHEDFVHYDDYFYPLDGIHHWNRIYGRKGFLQYQFVLPKENSYDGLKTILEKIGRSGQGSPLAVLKLFGKQNPHSVMSFPMEGYTLALDFKVNAEVFRLLDKLDEVVLKNGGRLYLAKDARMSPRVFHETYSKIVPSNKFNSAQTSRLEF